MSKKLSYSISISKENSPLDTPPYRAYLYWLDSGQLIKSEDFSESELVVEIKRLKAEGSEYIQAYQEALNQLNNSNLNKN